MVDPKASDHGDWMDAAHAEGVQVHIVASAEEALRLFRTTAVDLWVINVELPALSGYELCGMLKDRSPHTAVYLLTDEYSPEAERAAWAARATMFGCQPGHTALLREWIAGQSRSRATIRPTLCAHAPRN